MPSPAETSVLFVCQFLPPSSQPKVTVMPNTALVVGASGIVGSNLARRLRARGWRVLGLARRPPADIEGVHAVAADLLDRTSLRTALAGLRPTHVFLATWL